MTYANIDFRIKSCLKEICYRICSGLICSRSVPSGDRTDITGEVLWPAERLSACSSPSAGQSPVGTERTLRGKFCDQLNDCQLVRHHLNFNYKGKESILFITLFRPPQPHCSYQSCARAFGLNIMHLLFFVLVFVTSLFNVQRSNNYNDYHVWLSVPLSSICPSVFNISTPLEGFP